MREEQRQETVLRFEISVHGGSYRALVDGLSAPTARARTRGTPQAPVKAAIELDLASGHYSLATIGKHKLPRALRVNPGSQSHSNLTNYLSSHLTGDTAKTVSALLSDIIQTTPSISAEALRLFREDIELGAASEIAIGRDSSRKVFVVDEFTTELLVDLDDAPTLITPDVDVATLDQATSLIQRSFIIRKPITATARGNLVEISARISIPVDLAEKTDLYLHWGNYDEPSLPWRDEIVNHCRLTSNGTYDITHSLHIPERGNYGFTIFLQLRGTTSPIWIGEPYLGDARVRIELDDHEFINQRRTFFDQTEALALKEISCSLASAEQLAATCHALASSAPHLGLGSLLMKAVGIDGLQPLLDRAENIRNEGTDTSALISAIRNFGVGEIVFATPEGPHAAAGGLAQVISGLPPELTKTGIPVTIIAPLYAYENGNRHTSAQKLLRNGIKLGGKKVYPEPIGSIEVPLGPTYHSGTTWFRRHPSLIPIRVYMAQVVGLRLFLLSNTSVFDRLYQPVYSDEQLRRAVTLSRAVLETIATPHFGIRPSAVISNDWMTACIPPLFALDSRYRKVAWLSECKTIHMIHNGGADYHGRLPINVNREDLWPMLNLGPEHFFGFRDPHNSELVNLTMAATRHVNGAVLTVSPLYAEQISSPGGGDGLEANLGTKRSSVFGISNGISRTDIDAFLCSVADRPTKSFESLHDLLDAKALIQEKLQARFGLDRDPTAQIASFVGRFAEQKGISLLSGFIDGASHSTLEELLKHHPKLQLIFAGPITEGDADARAIRNTLGYLAQRYPGRVKAHLEYIPHSQALEIIFGSRFFFMPSRFEPGGITQLEALAAGTLVIGRAVGGIAATIENYDPSRGDGNGFLCNDYTPTAFANTAHWALSTAADQDTYLRLVTNATTAQHSWNDRVPDYRQMLQAVVLR